MCAVINDVTKTNVPANRRLPLSFISCQNKSPRESWLDKTRASNQRLKESYQGVSILMAKWKELSLYSRAGRLLIKPLNPSTGLEKRQDYRSVGVEWGFPLFLKISRALWGWGYGWGFLEAIFSLTTALSTSAKSWIELPFLYEGWNQERKAESSSPVTPCCMIYLGFQREIMVYLRRLSHNHFLKLLKLIKLRRKAGGGEETV